MSENYIIFHHLGYLSNKTLKDYNTGVKGVDLICKIDLPSVPQSINDNNSSGYNSTTILGRSAPVYSYVSSGPRQINFTMKLHREMLDKSDYSSYQIDNIANQYVSLAEVKKQRGSLETLIDCLQLAVVPTYTNSTMIIPPKVTVCIENLKVTGIVRSANNTWELPVINGKYAVSNISLSVDEIDPYDTASILRLGGYRGL